MSIYQQVLNASAPYTEAWPGYVAQNLPPTNRLILIGLLNLPVLVVVLNIIWQLLPSSDRTTPPTVFHWLPYIGSGISYGNDPIGFFSDCQKKHGNVFTFVFFGRNVTCCLGAKGNNFVLGGKSTAFAAEDVYKHVTVPVFGEGVVYDIPNDKFMEQKKFVKVGLSMENLRSYVGMIEEEVEDFIKSDRWFTTFQANNTTEWGAFEADKVMQEITILTASRTLQGKEVRAGLDKSFSETFNDLDGGFQPINFLFPNLPLASYRRRDRAQVKMTEFYLNIIQQRKAGPDNDESDMIAALMSQRYRNGADVPDHEVAHMMIALLMAGQHTSSASGAWSILHLADNPDVAEALYEEQVKYFGTPDGRLRQMTYEEMRTLPLLDAVIRETLRIHPPIHSIFRNVRDPVVVPATLAAPSKDSVYVVPKGNWVLACPALSQVDPCVWRNAKAWDPLRWSDPEGVAAQAFKDYADEHGEKVDFGYGAVSKGTDSPYQPFGAGRHRCIGEQFAYLQLGTVITTFIRNMELKLTAPVPEHNYHTMIVMPKKSTTVSYRRRHLD